jgi:hypothetical protein
MSVPTPTDADVERVKLAIWHSWLGGAEFEDRYPCVGDMALLDAMARAAIAAMPAPASKGEWIRSEDE